MTQAMRFRDPFPAFAEQPFQFRAFADQECWSTHFHHEDPDTFRPSRDRREDDRLDHPTLDMPCCALAEGLYVVQLSALTESEVDESFPVVLKCKGGMHQTTRGSVSLSAVIEAKIQELGVTTPIPLDINLPILRHVLKYCEYHTNIRNEIPTLSLEELVSRHEQANEWDSRFVLLEPKVLCEVASAAYNLDIKPLVSLACRAIATLIADKSPEEIRVTFDISDGLETAQNQLPSVTSFLSSATSSQSLPLSKQQLQMQKNGGNFSSFMSGFATAKGKSTKHSIDDRSLEELLDFINDGDKKKKKKTKADKKKVTPIAQAPPKKQQTTKQQQTPKEPQKQQQKQQQQKQQQQHDSSAEADSSSRTKKTENSTKSRETQATSTPSNTKPTTNKTESSTSTTTTTENANPTNLPAKTHNTKNNNDSNKNTNDDDKSKHKNDDNNNNNNNNNNNKAEPSKQDSGAKSDGKKSKTAKKTQPEPQQQQQPQPPEPKKEKPKKKNGSKVPAEHTPKDFENQNKIVDDVDQEVAEFARRLESVPTKTKLRLDPQIWSALTSGLNKK